MNFKGQSAYIYPIDETNSLFQTLRLCQLLNQPQLTHLSTHRQRQLLSLTRPIWLHPPLLQPTIQSALPLSFNLISENPASLHSHSIRNNNFNQPIAVWSAKKPKKHRPLNQTFLQLQNLAQYLQSPPRQSKATNSASFAVQATKPTQCTVNNAAKKSAVNNVLYIRLNGWLSISSANHRF